MTRLYTRRAERRTPKAAPRAPAAPPPAAATAEGAQPPPGAIHVGDPVFRLGAAPAPASIPAIPVETPIMTDTPAAPEAAAERPEMRADPRAAAMRPDLRERDSLAEARARAAEIMAHGDDWMADGVDHFEIERQIIPPGWDYQWKRETLIGKSDPAYDVRLARGGWAPVPAARHPAFMPKDSTDAAIRRDGMILMERPMEITKRRERYEYEKAVGQVRGREAQLGQAPQGQFARVDERGRPTARVRTEIGHAIATTDKSFMIPD